VSGGTSQSLVNEEGGAKTPLSTALAAVFILCRALFLPSIERAASTGARRRGFGGDRGFAKSFNVEGTLA
jgi:Sulfate permease and related transporters (MFS superfamily)